MTAEPATPTLEPPPGDPLTVVVDAAADGATTVRAVGEIDLLTVAPLQRALDGAVVAGGPVVVDLRGIEFMDSTGLRLLLETRNRAHDRLTLVLGDALPVRRLLDMTGVFGLFRLA